MDAPCISSTPSLDQRSAVRLATHPWLCSPEIDGPMPMTRDEMPGGRPAISYNALVLFEQVACRSIVLNEKPP